MSQTPLSSLVEVAYNEIQRSPKYESGYALRFARIKRIRGDKSPDDIDTYARLEDLFEKQFERKGVLRPTGTETRPLTR